TVEGAAETASARPVAIPAHLHHDALKARARDGRCEPRRRGAGVEHDVGVTGRRIRSRKLGAQRLRERPASFVHIHTCHLRPSQPRPHPPPTPPPPPPPARPAPAAANSTPTPPAPTTTMRSPGPAPASQMALSAVSRLAVSVARRAGTPSSATRLAAAATK